MSLAIDERLDRLTGVVDKLARSTAAHDSAIEKLTGAITAQKSVVETLAGAVTAHDYAIEAHDRPIAALIELTDRNAKQMADLDRPI